MTLSQAIFAAVTAAPAFSGVAGNRLYPGMADQEALPPYAVYQIVAGSDVPTQDDAAESVTSTLRRTIVQFSAHASTWAVANALSESIHAALAAIETTGSGIRVLLEAGPRHLAGPDPARCRTDVDLAFWHHLPL